MRSKRPAFAVALLLLYNVDSCTIGKRLSYLENFFIWLFLSFASFKHAVCLYYPNSVIVSKSKL